MPLTIYFRSSSSTLKVVQEHMQSKGDVQHSYSEDEPYILKHSVTKPIIQEVREIITPSRKIVQEIQPVQEEIITIVNRAEDGQTRKQTYERPFSMYETNQLSSMDRLDERIPDMTTSKSINNLFQTHLPAMINNKNNLPVENEFANYSRKTESTEYVNLAYDQNDPAKPIHLYNHTETSTTTKSILNNLSSTSTTTSTTESPTTMDTVVKKNRKRRKHRTSEKRKSNVMSHEVTGETPSRQSHRLFIKKVANKIDHQKDKIRLGFFSIYGINLIPFIYDEYSFNVKVGMPPAKDN